MVNRTLVTAIQIRAWSATNEAKQVLPELIRRLCSATSKRPTMIDFPARESTSTEGYDGTVQAEGLDEDVPEGASVWELSAQKGSTGKAKGDFIKRVLEPLGQVQEDVTYVACTTRLWKGKKKLETEWNGQSVWKAVRLYDCDNIEKWLQRAPAVHIWFSRLLNSQPPGVKDVDLYWENWSVSTEPATPKSLVTIGYEEEAKELFRRLCADDSVVYVRSDSREFSSIFIAACLLSNADLNTQRFGARTVFVDTVEAWEYLVLHHEGLILIPTFDASDRIGMAIQRKHTILLPLGQEDRDVDGSIRLEHRHQSVLDPVIREMYPDDFRSYQRSERAATSFSAFRRSIMRQASKPKWVDPSYVSDLLPVLLAGGWDESSEEDRKTLSRLAGRQYEEFVRSLSPWLTIEDSPVRKVGSVYRVADRRDAWEWLSPFLDDYALGAFMECTKDLLMRQDPRWDPDERIRRFSRMMRQGTIVSMALKSGLADTLAILGALGSGVNKRGERRGDKVASSVTYALLFREIDDQGIWNLSDHFKELAEADPERFMEFFEREVKERPERIKSLFQDDGRDIFNGVSPHTELLWALESLAWNPIYLNRISVLLAHLTRLDPGGKTGNRPIGSLIEIFMSWSPGTLANSEQQVNAIDFVRAKVPSVAWPLMLKLLPSGTQTCHSTSEPKYRPWGRLWRIRPTNGDRIYSCLQLSSRAIDDAGADARRWCDLVGRFEGIHPDCYGLYFERLCSAAEDMLDVDRRVVSETIRDFVARHAKYPDAEWSLAKEPLDRLRTAAKCFEPRDPILGELWLFSNRVRLDEVDDENEPLARNERLRELRDQAVSRILEDDEAKVMQAVAEQVDEPGIWGFSVGLNRAIEGEREFLGAYLRTGVEKIQNCARGYVNGRSQREGVQCLTSLYNDPWTREQSIDLRVAVLSAMPFGTKTLEYLDEGGEELAHAFWGLPGVQGGLFLNSGLEQRVIEGLIKHGRFTAATQTIHYLSEDRFKAIPKTMILDALEGLVLSAKECSPDWGDLSHGISEILTGLEDAGDELRGRICTLELVFARLTDSYRPPRTVQRVIAADPGSYIQLVEAAYAGEDGEALLENAESVGIPEEAARAVLESRGPLPGQQGESVDSERLIEWYDSAKELAVKSNRLRVFRLLMGEWLARSPMDSEGFWPHSAVCRLFEREDDPVLEESFKTAVHNDRGVTMRMPGDGGAQERLQAARYRGYQEKLMTQYLRITKVLGDIADDYLDQAERYDRGRG